MNESLHIHSLWLDLYSTHIFSDRTASLSNQLILALRLVYSIVQSVLALS